MATKAVAWGMIVIAIVMCIGIVATMSLQAISGFVLGVCAVIFLAMGNAILLELRKL